MSILDSSYASWSILLVLGVPFLIILLNEIIDRIRKKGSPYVSVVCMLRDLVLPLMVLTMVLRLVFVVSDDNLPTKVISSIFWVVFTVSIFRLSRIVVGTGEYTSKDWRSHIPQLFLRLPPYAIMGVIVFHIIQNLWSLPIKEMATTLGIGSIVVAFALQDTLSNLVSGLLLVTNSPFKTGEWVHVGDVEGKILAVNWRYTQIENWNGDMVVIPNGSIANEAIENHSRPTTLTAVTETVKFDFSHPPNVVKEILIDTMLKCPGVLSDPAPAAAVLNLSNPVIEYEIEFWIDGYEQKPDVLEAVLTRFWYASRRENIKIPARTYDLTTHVGASADVIDSGLESNRKFQLENIPHIANLSDHAKQLIQKHGRFMHYAHNERIVTANSPELGVFAVSSGSVDLKVNVSTGEDHLLESLSPGGFFCATGVYGRAISRFSVDAGEDSMLLNIPHDIFRQILDENTQFAIEFDSIINLRGIRENRIRDEHDRSIKSDVQKNVKALGEHA